MDSQVLVKQQRARRQGHVRRIVRLTKRLRLSVFRSNKHITAQIIDDDAGKTVAFASTQQKDVKEGLKSTSSKEAAQKVGKVLAERAKAAGVAEVAFDRGYYRYHGRIAALADAAREAGLKF